MKLSELSSFHDILKVSRAIQINISYYFKRLYFKYYYKTFEQRTCFFPDFVRILLSNEFLQEKNNYYFKVFGGGCDRMRFQTGIKIFAKGTCP